MKKCTWIILFVLTGTMGLMAQSNDSTTTKSESKEYTFSGRKVLMSNNNVYDDANYENVVSVELLGWRKPTRFNSHWSGFEMGMNNSFNTTYSIYSNDKYGSFMDLNAGKSIAVNINFLELNIPLSASARFGMYSGMGITFNNLRFDDRITITKNTTTNRVEPVPLDVQDLRKSKITLTYLTIPLMMEYQFRHNGFIAGGLVGSVLVQSHTKVKADGNKDKDHSSFYLNPLKYAAQLRAGASGFNIFINYDLSPLFEKNKGPEMQLYSVGLGISF